MSDIMTQEEAMNMSNEQAVQILIPMRNMMCDQNGCPISDAVFALDKAIEALSADRPQEWIPCSERLPKENGEYIVSLEDSIYPWAKFFNGKWFMLSINAIAREFGEYEVIAWMPLPDPYREDGEA